MFNIASTSESFCNLLGGALAHYGRRSGVPGPLGYWTGPLLGGLVALGFMGLGSGTRLVSGWWGLSPLIPGRPLPYVGGASVRGLPLRPLGVWLSLPWASQVLCSVGAAGGLALGVCGMSSVWFLQV